MKEDGIFFNKTYLFFYRYKFNFLRVKDERRGNFSGIKRLEDVTPFFTPTALIKYV